MPSSQNRQTSIFLCYATEDRARVHELYRALKSAGFSPWMDKPPGEFYGEGLEAGVSWDTEIRSRIKNSDYFFACLSGKSVEKRGYVQREYRMALDQMAEIPEGGVFLIPVLLEECEVPSIRVDTVDFQSIQWFRLYEDGVDNLIGTLERRENRLNQLAQSSDPLLAGEDLELMEAVERHKRVLEEGNILHVELHDTVSEFDEQLKELISRARPGGMARDAIVAQFAGKLSRFAGQLAPLVDDLERARRVNARSFLETTALMSDSEAADQQFLDEQIRLHRRTGRTASVLRGSASKSHQILVGAQIRDSRAFNRARRQAVLALERLIEDLAAEEARGADQISELERLRQLLPNAR